MNLGARRWPMSCSESRMKVERPKSEEAMLMASVYNRQRDTLRFMERGGRTLPTTRAARRIGHLSNQNSRFLATYRSYLPFLPPPLNGFLKSL